MEANNKYNSMSSDTVVIFVFPPGSFISVATDKHNEMIWYKILTFSQINSIKTVKNKNPEPTDD